MTKETPLMKQYSDIKSLYKEEIVLFRMGDFYETFGEDARETSRILNITLTKRNKKEGASLLAGFPHHALDQYLPKLVESNKTVVIVEQLEDPKMAKGIVKRGVTQIISPATLERTLPSFIYLMSIYRDKNGVYICLCDTNTGDIKLINNIKLDDISIVLSQFPPKEILVNKLNFDADWLRDYLVQPIDNRLLKKVSVDQMVRDIYSVQSIESLGLDKNSSSHETLKMMFVYLKDRQLQSLNHLKRPVVIDINNRMLIERSALKSINLLGDTSLFSALDNMHTLMGKRLLYDRINRPLTDANEIYQTHRKVDKYILEQSRLEQDRTILNSTPDLDKLIKKLANKVIKPSDLIALKNSLVELVKIEDLNSFEAKIRLFAEIVSNKISDTASDIDKDDFVIKEGVNKDLDRYRSVRADLKDWLNSYIVEIRDRTGIQSIKIGYNGTFGYYIEVTKANVDRIPSEFIGKQTLTNATRYTTESLQNKETEILESSEKIRLIQQEEYFKLLEDLSEFIYFLREVSDIVAFVDLSAGFAVNAIERRYVKPTILDSSYAFIKTRESRHPILELMQETEFITNDIDISNANEEKSFHIMTGPNMAGKSTYMRQIALLVVMTQIGSFVPAFEHQQSIIKKLYARIGASDDILRGRSTFLVEMEECSNILSNADTRSLVLLDEIGRGTSTYDGISLAWAISEEIIKRNRSLTIFATHYHELTEIESFFPTMVMNTTLSILEENDKVHFLRKVREGKADQSYGIYVAQIAGLPKRVIDRSRELLLTLESNKSSATVGAIHGTDDLNTAKEVDKSSNKPSHKSIKKDQNLNLFPSQEEMLVEEVKNIDPDTLTPKSALDFIYKIKRYITVVIFVLFISTGIYSVFAHPVDNASISIFTKYNGKGDLIEEGNLEGEIISNWVQVSTALGGNAIEQGFGDILKQKESDYLRYLEKGVQIKNNDKLCSLESLDLVEKSNEDYILSSVDYKFIYSCDESLGFLEIDASIYSEISPLQTNIVNVFDNPAQLLKGSTLTNGNWNISLFVDPNLPSTQDRFDNEEPNTNSVISYRLLDKFANDVNNLSTTSILLIILVAVIIGFLHTLEGGHSKIILSSLIINKGISLKQSILFSFMFTVTHISDIIIITVALLLTQSIEVVYENSGNIAFFARYGTLFLGISMLFKEGSVLLKKLYNKRFASDLIKESVIYANGSSNVFSKTSGSLKEQLIIAVLEGLAPCLTGWSMMMMIIASNRYYLIFPVIVGFGVGVFILLAILSLSVYKAKDKLFNRFSFLSYYSQVISAFVIIVVTIYLYF